MSQSESQADQPKPSEQRPDSGSVFGNLPKQRPGSRSPRRAQGDGAAAASKPKAKTGAKKRPAAAKRAKSAGSPAANKPPAPASAAQAEDLPQPPPPPGPPRPQHGSEPIGGIEDLAWAGVTVAAQAATVGVKLASRALEAVRKSVERP